MKKHSNLDGILYPVRKVKSVDINPNFDYSPQQEYKILVDINGTEKEVNSCSEQYHLVPNAEVIKPLLAGLKDFDIDVSYTNKNDARFTLDIVFKGSALDIMPGDKILPRLRMNNSYDGRVRYAYMMGFYRMICSNGIVVPVEGFEDTNMELKMRHTPSLEDYVDTDAIIEMVKSFQEGIDKFTKPFKILSKQKVMSIEERAEEVIKATKYPKRQLEPALDRLNVELGLLNSKPNDWLMYNAFNYQLNHSDDMTMDQHKREKIDRSVLSYLLEN